MKRSEDPMSESQPDPTEDMREMLEAFGVAEGTTCAHGQESIYVGCRPCLEAAFVTVLCQLQERAAVREAALRKVREYILDGGPPDPGDDAEGALKMIDEVLNDRA